MAGAQPLGGTPDRCRTTPPPCGCPGACAAPRRLPAGRGRAAAPGTSGLAQRTTLLGRPDPGAAGPAGRPGRRAGGRRPASFDGPGAQHGGRPLAGGAARPDGTTGPTQFNLATLSPAL